METARNIELKARLHDLPAAREIARRLATKHLGIQQQTDTYFHCSQGRMKLREIADFGPQQCHKPLRTAQLIAYDRPDGPDAKASDYQLIEISDPDRIRKLKSEMGIQVIVDKRREIFLQHNVRIHLDEVAGLGTFIEFEAVLGKGIDEPTGRAQVAELQSQFGIAQVDLLSPSYADLLLGESRVGGIR